MVFSSSDLNHVHVSIQKFTITLICLPICLSLHFSRLNAIHILVDSTNLWYWENGYERFVEDLKINDLRNLENIRIRKKSIFRWWLGLVHSPCLPIFYLLNFSKVDIKVFQYRSILLVFLFCPKYSFLPKYMLRKLQW